MYRISQDSKLRALRAGRQHGIPGKYNLTMYHRVLWHCRVPLFPACSHILGAPSFRSDGNMQEMP